MSENRPKAPVPISLESYPNASRASANQDQNKPKAKPKQEAIIKEGHVKLKKQSAWKKAKHRIFEQEGKDLKEYVVYDVLIPSIKDTISNIVSNGIDILLYGEARHLNAKRSGILSSSPKYNHVSYSSISSNKPVNSSVRRSISSSSALRSNLALDDFIFQTRGEANDILNQLSTILTDYGVVTVADLYELCGLRTPYTYNNYAWRDLSTAGVSMTRDGYLLNLPTPQTLD